VKEIYAVREELEVMAVPDHRFRVGSGDIERAGELQRQQQRSRCAGVLLPCSKQPQFSPGFVRPLRQRWRLIETIDLLARRFTEFALCQGHLIT